MNQNVITFTQPYQHPEEVHYFVSSFGHWKVSSDCFDAMEYVANLDRQAFGKYKPGSKAKKARDYSIDMVVYSIPGKPEDHEISEYLCDEFKRPQIKGAKFLFRCHY